jgi:hypothetical protein
MQVCEENKSLAPSTQDQKELMLNADGTPLSFGEPKTLREAVLLSRILAASRCVPSYLQGNPEGITAVMLKAKELGIPMMAGLENIMLVNNRASVWGDLLIALIRRSPMCEYLTIKLEGEGKDLKGVFKSKRKGEPEEQVYTYTLKEAEENGLLASKKGTWGTYTNDMLMRGAVRRGARYAWADVTQGVDMREFAYEVEAVAQDNTPKALPQAKVVDAAPSTDKGADTSAPTAAPAEPEKRTRKPKEPKPEPEAAKPTPEPEKPAETKAPELATEPAPEAAPEIPQETDDGFVAVQVAKVGARQKSKAEPNIIIYYALFKGIANEYTCQSKESAQELAGMKDKGVLVKANAKREIIAWKKA